MGRPTRLAEILGRRVFHSSRQWFSMRDVKLEAQRAGARRWTAACPSHASEGSVLGLYKTDPQTRVRGGDGPADTVPRET